MSRLDESPTASNVAEYSVSEISGALKRTVEDAFGHVRVRGEVSGYRGPHSSGHAYFCLKDDRARIDAVIWRTSFARLAFKPEEGLEVIATGKLTTYPGSSKYQIVIETIEPAGAGALMALLNERKRKLEAEGLFSADRKQRLPYLPRVIGIVTSPTGAVIRDIHHRIADRFPVRLIVWPVRVQGETSGDEVARGIEGFNALEPDGAIPQPDLIIVARGGGSLEDLWGFNDEAVVRAAAASTIPLISAVGHETDWTLIDHAADRRAPTPTGAAEIAVPVRAELLANLVGLHARQAGAISRRLDQERKSVAATARALPSPDMLLALPRRRLDEATTALGQCLRVAISEKRRHYGDVASRLSPSRLDSLIRDKRSDLRHQETRASHALQSRLHGMRQRFERTAAGLQPYRITLASEAARLRLDTLGERLSTAQVQATEARRQRIAAAWRMADSLNPLRVLERGYAIIRGEADEPIVRADGLTPGMAFTVQFAGNERRPAVATGDGGSDADPTAAKSGVTAPAKPSPRRRAAAKKPVEGQGSLF
ncbi:exodeoxyribonuclease VII large subunit [Aurantimonas marina]|uniref:exodeoxyribonuclease VII large subunit n=1 Tax=Aurantimonas marina TaxID=2780508 RepID=UPI0019D28F3D|nr:exodeoxyribonuclease VII large subunit [Aurantimonas marina]